MFNDVPKSLLIQHGRKLLTDFLLEQAGYTFGIAAAEGKTFREMFPEAFLEESRSVYDQVVAACKDKALMAEAAKDATSDQDAAAKRAKVWRRKAVGRAKRATRFGRQMPNGLLRIGIENTLAGLTGQINEMVALFEENLSAMPGTNAQALLDEGKAIASLLSTADADQDVKRRRDLPQALQNFYELKGKLYLAIKAVNDAGHELYADDANAAGLFNLHILYRRGTRGRSEPAASAA